MIWATTNDGIEIQLPITTPTGKVRVKRPINGQIATPVPCRSRDMALGDYLEWQIGYDTPEKTEPSLVPEVELRKKQGLRYGYELTRLIVECRRLNLLPVSRWHDLRQHLDYQRNNDGIEETEAITYFPAPLNTLAGRFGFDQFIHQVPVFLKSTRHYAVEIKIGPKQRAVGLQAMIFVHLPLAACMGTSSALAGRKAHKQEHARYTITSANADLVYDTTLAFVLASRSHAEDIHRIFLTLGL